MFTAVKGALRRLSLFWRYFFLLALLLLLFLLSMTAMTRRFAGVLRSSRLEQVQTSFEKNCELFSRDVFKTYALPSILEESDFFAAAGSVGAPSDLQYLYPFSKVRDTFGTLCAVQDLPTESFLYFRKSGVCVTRSRIFPDADSFFGSYLVYEDRARMPDLTTRRALPRLQLLPLSEISVNGRAAQPFLTVLVRNTAHQTLYGFLYPRQDVLDAFQMDTLPAGSVLRFTHADGTAMLVGGQAGREADFVWLEEGISSLSCRVELGVPLAYFDAAARGTQAAANVSFLLIALIGVALCVLFSHFSVRPFRRLIRAHGDGGGARVNELAALDDVLNAARQQNDSLQSMFLSSLLIRSAAGLSVSEEEYQRALAAFPVFRQSMRAATVYDRAADDETDDTYAMGSLLQPLLPDGFLYHYNSMQESLLFLPDTEEARQALADLLSRLNDGAAFDLRFVCGVSDPFLGLNEAGAAIRQAQSCVPDGEERMIAYPDDAPVPFDPEQLRRSLADRDRGATLALLEQLAAQAGKRGAPLPEELFYRVLALLRDSARADRLAFDEYARMTYQHSRSPASNLRRLKTAAGSLFDQWAAAQRTDKQRRGEQIVQYIRENFSDATLCLASLSRQFHVSERFVYNSVMESTGMNVSTFLAQTRMTEAARLLRQTDESVGAVAEKCGYPVESTFYRNFKKYYHVTPAEYKGAPRGERSDT